MQKLMPHSPLKSVLQQLCYEALDNPMANGIQIASAEDRLLHSREGTP